MSSQKVWTLFVMGPKKRDWGFHTEHGWIHHTDYPRYMEERKAYR